MATVSVRYIVDDVDEAIAFYCGHLGFVERMHPAPTFAMLDRGDAILSRGCECPQWRGEFDGDYHCQGFFHFVDRNGPYSEWRFDKRPALGRPSVVAARQSAP